jgi:hypothetical protein
MSNTNKRWPDDNPDDPLIDGYPASFYENDGTYDPDPFRKWDAEGRQWAEDLIADRQKIRKRQNRKAKG